MWQIVRAELRYGRFAFLIFFMTAPLLVLLNVMSEDGERIYVVWFVAIMLLNYWNAKRIREKREYLLAELPLSRSDVGLARAVMIVLLPAAYILLFALVDGALGMGGPNLKHLAFIFGVAVVIFAALMMFRDRFAGTKSLMRGKIVLVSIMAALAATGIAMMIVTEEAMESGGEPPAALRVFEYAARHSPLSHPLYLLCFVAGSLLLAYGTVFTFRRRRNNFE